MERLVYCHELADIIARGAVFGPDVHCSESGEIEGTSANGYCLACGATDHESA